MTDLFAASRDRAVRSVAPLAVRMRPRTLEEFAGQGHILGEGKLLRRMIEADALTSVILHGPPGTGKTTLAEVIAHATRRHFERENAAGVGVKRIREIIEEAEVRLSGEGRRTILFLDEIHRFTKAQQDVLLPDTERGLITLIGATTENPLFACNSALISRSTLFRLESLSEAEVMEVLRRAIADRERGFGDLPLRVSGDALAVWARLCEGDARRALTALEVAVLSVGRSALRADNAGFQPGRTSDEASGAGGPGFRPGPRTSARSHTSLSERDPTLPACAEADRATGESHGLEARATGASASHDALHEIRIDRDTAEASIQRKAAVYGDDQHYDMASALIKSLRGSDPDAAIYWIAAMLEGGEDPRFIARRLAILASEDIGNADPRAIMIAQAGWELVERIGMPEARITLGQVAVYLALAPKSNASYVAIDAALADVRQGRTIPVPMFLRDPNSSPEGQTLPGERSEKRTRDYEYSHKATETGRVTGQDYLGVLKRYYEPSDQGVERTLAERLAEIRKLRERLRDDA